MVAIDKRGRSVEVVLGIDQYHRKMDTLDNAEDVKSFDEAMTTEGKFAPFGA